MTQFSFARNYIYILEIINNLSDAIFFDTNLLLFDTNFSRDPNLLLFDTNFWRDPNLLLFDTNFWRDPNISFLTQISKNFRIFRNFQKISKIRKISEIFKKNFSKLNTLLTWLSLQGDFASGFASQSLPLTWGTGPR